MDGMAALDQAETTEGHSPQHRSFVLAVMFTITASTVVASQLTKSAQSGLNAPFFVMYTHLILFCLCWPVAKICSRGERVTASARDVMILLPLTVASSYCYVKALGFAPASLVQILFGVSPATVALLSRALLGEPLTVIRIVAVVLALFGTTVIGIAAQTSDRRDSVSLLLGGGLTLLAVLASAGYKVIFRLRLGKPSMCTVLGCLGTYGIISSVLGLPIAILLAATGVEDRWWDMTSEVNWWSVFGSAAIDFVYNLVLNYGLSITSPVLVAFSLILGTPANMVVDAALRGTYANLMEIVGAFLIINSFAVLACPPAFYTRSCAREGNRDKPSQPMLDASNREAP